MKKVVTITIRIDPDVKDELDAEAAADERSFSSLVSLILKRHVSARPALAKTVKPKAKGSAG